MRDPAEIARRLDELQQKIGIAFRKPALLQEALSHSSFANENPSLSPHDNERLEYLGDAVLQLISAEFLFKGRPDAAEGEMTQVRSSMVNTQALAALSEDLGMGEYLLLGKGIARGGGRNLRSLLANAFEAVLGAIFLDQGYDAAYHYCMERFRALPEADVPENFKGRLQHLVQDRFGVTPVYDVIGARAQSGRMREYTAVVYAGGDPLGTGHGRTKQMAEQTAAREAIRKLAEEVAAAAGETEELPRAEREEPGVEEVIGALTAAGEAELPLTSLPEGETAPVPQPSAPVEIPPAAAAVEEPEAAAPPEAVAPTEQVTVVEPPAEPSAGGWQSRRQVAERAATERRRPRPQPDPGPAPAAAGGPAAIAEPPAPVPPSPQIAPGRQFGAPAAEVEVEIVTAPLQVEHLVAAPPTSRMPAESASAPIPRRQFGQPVEESPQKEEAQPPPPRRASRPRRSSRAPAAAAPAAATATATEPADTPQAEAISEPAKPARRRTTRARQDDAPKTAEPAPGTTETDPQPAATTRRRTTRRGAGAQEAGADEASR